MYKSINRVFVLTKRNIKEILRDPLSLAFTVALPLVMQILFYLIFHNLTTQFEMRYLAPGIVVFSQSFLTLFTGLLISVDRKTAFLTRLYVSSAKPHEFISGYALSVLPIAIFQSILFFLVGGVFDASLFSVKTLAAVGLSVITSLFFIAAGILFGSICGEKSVGGITSIVITGQSVLSGMWFPLEGMGGGIITFMNVLPFKNATALVKNTVNGIADVASDFLYPLIIVLLYTLITFSAAIFAFKKKMKDN